MKKWIYSHNTPSDGKVFYKDDSNDIIVVRGLVVFLYINCKTKFPASAEYGLKRFEGNTIKFEI